MSQCIFCKIVAGEIKSTIIAQNELAIAIADIHPQAPVHLLMIPKRHLASLNDMTDSDRKEILPALYSLADEVSKLKGIRERGYRTVINNQAEGGQVVFHLHLHILGGGKLKGM